MNLYRSHPFLAQMITAGTLFGVGDVVGQQVYEPLFFTVNSTKQEKPPTGPRHDFLRTAKMAAYGFFVAAPSTWVWYKFLERKINLAGGPIRTTVARVIVDQVVFAPAFIGVFFAVSNLMDKQPKAGLLGVQPREYFEALSANYRVWPWVQMANFYFVPLEYRLAVVNVVAIGWNGYLSWKRKQ